MIEREIQIGGVDKRIWVARIGDQLWFHVDGQTWVVPAAESEGGASKGRGSKTHAGRILAPMPGKVTKVAVKAGDKVVEGQTVVVMEAMKMEYTLSADIAGAVKDVRVTVGAQVKLGDLLAEIEARV